MAVKPILWFSEITVNDNGIAGGKGVNLGIMYNLKLPVPPGFVVTAQAYKFFTEKTGIQQKILNVLKDLDVEDTEKLQKASEQIQEIILDAKMPKIISDAIVEAYDDLNVDRAVSKAIGGKEVLNTLIKSGRELPFVAVRSSATAEDQPEFSFAGQQATYLNVKGKDDVVLAVQKCWASLFTARAIYYRTKNNFPHDKVLIAVVVQKMVNSDRSGVMFSVNPATNNESEIMIEAAFGLGEVVVGGEITPDTYIVDKATFAIKSKKVARQNYGLFRDPYTGKNIKKEFGEAEGSKQKLTEEEIIAYAKYARALEEHYKKPMDSEWAIENGKLYLVQTRPVTTLLKKKSEAPRVEAKDMKEIIRGLGASPGVGTGKVKIIKDLTELSKVEKGDVLITRMTSPDMVSAMRKAVAIATDEGGVTCIGGDGRILTNFGFIKFKDLGNSFNLNKEIYTLSLDSKNNKICWRKILAIMKRKCKVVELLPYIHPTKKAFNGLKITLNHRMITLYGDTLQEEILSEFISKNHKLLVADFIPIFEADKTKINSSKLMYLAGAFFSDGHIAKRKSGRPMRVLFTQKLIPEKINFINQVKSNFNELFDSELKNYVKEGAIIKQTGHIRAACFQSSRAYPSMVLNTMKEQIIQIMSTVDLDLIEDFLAGLLDGDGHFNREKEYLELYINKKDTKLLEGVVIGCLRLSILPKVRTRKKSVYTIILSENINRLLKKCKRVQGYQNRIEDYKLFDSKQLIIPLNIKDWRGKLHKYLDNDVFIGINYLSNYLKGHADQILLNRINKLQNSDFRMYRYKVLDNNELTDVYNITVDADLNIDHNYVVFTDDYIPLIVGNCHAAIVSRELGVPCIVGTEKITQLVHDGDLITVDGTDGVVYSGDVGSGLVHESTEEKHDVTISGEAAESLVTGTKIFMNLGEPEKIDDYKNLPFDGIGLMRIEFVITDHIGKHPLYMIQQGQQQEYIDKLAEGISKVARAINPRPVVVRFSDFKTNEYKNLPGGEQFEPHEENPLIGWRGCSRYIHEDFREAFKLEVKAIKKLREQGLKNVHVMLPFVRTTDDVRKCLKILEEDGLVNNHEFRIYIMAEVPSVAFIPEEFAELPIYGASIGSNDLTMLVLGLDRDNARLGKMGYFDERNPAVLRALSNIIKGFKKHGKTVSICGQSVSEYEEIVEFLVKEGIDSVSVNPDVVVKTRKLVASVERSILLGKIRGY